MTHPSSIHAARRLAGLASFLGLVLASAPATASDDAPAVRLQPGWQDDARQLIYDGERPGGSAWHAPETLARGNYRVIQRDAQGAPHLVPMQRVQVKGITGERVVVFITTPVRTPEVIDERFLGVDPTRPDTSR